MGYWKGIDSGKVETGFAEEIYGTIYKLITIYAWRSDKQIKNKKAIAKVILTLSGDICVVYLNKRAKTDEMAQEFIQDTMAVIQDKFTIWIDDETRDDGTYDVMVYDEYAGETDWNLGVGHIPTLSQAEEILQSIIAKHKQHLFVKLPVKVMQ